MSVSASPSANNGPVAAVPQPEKHALQITPLTEAQEKRWCQGMELFNKWQLAKKVEEPNGKELQIAKKYMIGPWVDYIITGHTISSVCKHVNVECGLPPVLARIVAAYVSQFDFLGLNDTYIEYRLEADFGACGAGAEVKMPIGPFLEVFGFGEIQTRERWMLVTESSNQSGVVVDQDPNGYENAPKHTQTVIKLPLLSDETIGFVNIVAHATWRQLRG